MENPADHVFEKGTKCILKDLVSQSEYNGGLCKVIGPYHKEADRYIVYVYKAKQHILIKGGNLKIARLKTKTTPKPPRATIPLRVAQHQFNVLQTILSSTKHKKSNQAKLFANYLFKSNPQNQFDPKFNHDVKYMLSGNCIYIPSFFHPQVNYALFDYLMHDIKDCDMSHRFRRLMIRHLDKDDDESYLLTFKMIAQSMADYFEVDMKHSIINLYRDGTDYASFHTDKYDRDEVDITIGGSFGQRRELAFLHKETLQTFPISQHNNDIFAFTSVVNSKFRHSILKTDRKIGPRFSIIVWGKRRVLNEKNSSLQERLDRQKMLKMNPEYNVDYMYAKRIKPRNDSSQTT